MCSVPHSGKRWKTQDWSKPLRPFLDGKTGQAPGFSFSDANKNKGKNYAIVGENQKLYSKEKST